ncbi:BACON domain-containing protein [Chloroflexus sp.]|uniref:BACON domain-containing protein n=1 Tax=Chloroflexus sp. TaxID=1904827 RepID=UPI002605E77C|nr:BACON domain-containing protein [uncultured Chloroflexus sp.]
MRRQASSLSIIGLIAVLLISSIPFPPASRAAPEQPTRLTAFGMNTYFSGLERLPQNRNDDLAALINATRELGAAWVREEISWANLEPGQDSFTWNLMDAALLQAAQAGFGIIGMLLTTPAWARVGDCGSRITRNGGSVNYWCPPANPQDFADFVAAAVERYDGDGNSDAPGSPRVSVWQIWNEPNNWATWPGEASEYGALLAAGYAAAKAADPTAIVATGGVYIFDGGTRTGGNRDGLEFLGAAFTAVPAAQTSFDALAIHPYMPDTAPDRAGLFGLVSLWGRIINARSWLDARRGSAVPIWISELGWSTCNLTSPVCKNEQEQASYLARSYGIALALGVKHINWFQLEDKFDSPAGDLWGNAALLRNRNQSYARKLAANAYATLAHLLDEATFVGFGPLHSYVHQNNALIPAARYHLRFQTSTGALVDMFWTTGNPENLSLPLESGRSAQLISRDGTVLATNLVSQAQIPFSGAPVYLRQDTPPQLAVTPGNVTILASPADPAATYGITVQNLGSGNMNWSASGGASWLTLETSSGSGHTSRLRYRVDPNGLGPGDHTTSIVVDAGSAGAQSITITLRLVTTLYRIHMPLIAR